MLKCNYGLTDQLNEVTFYIYLKPQGRLYKY